MKRGLHYITILAFAAVALMPLLLSSSFLYTRHLLRERIEEQLEHDSLQTVSIPVNRISWIEAERELMIGHRLFDVKSYEIRDGIAILTGLFDDLEELAAKRLASSLAQLNDEEEEGSSGNAAFGVAFGCHRHHFLTSLPAGQIAALTAAVHSTPRLLSCTQSVPTPPPDPLLFVLS